MAQHIRDLGSFESIQQVWTALPGGGMEGDYLTINGNPFAWNKYIRQWQNDTTVINNPARETQTHDGDMNIGNDARIGGNLVVIGNIINDSIKNGLSAFELAVKGGYKGTEEQWLNSLIGKSAYQIWLEQAGNAGKGIEYFLAWMKDTKAIKGPKYIEDEALIDTVNDRMTLFYVNNGTSYKVVFVDELGGKNTLANRIGDITNYAGIYDVSADNELDGGIPKQYASLLEAIADIDENAKKGGMEIRYIDSSGKYVQYRFVGTDINNSNLNNWVFVGEKEVPYISGWIVGKISSTGSNEASNYFLRSGWVLGVGCIEVTVNEDYYIDTIMTFPQDGWTLQETILIDGNVRRIRYNVAEGLRSRVVIKRTDGGAMTTDMGDDVVFTLSSDGTKTFDLEDGLEDTNERVAAVEDKLNDGDLEEIPLVRSKYWRTNGWQSYDNVGYSRSEPVAVSEGQRIKVTLSVGAGCYGVWGCATSTFSSNGISLVGISTEVYDKIITIPSGVNYIFISSRNEDFSTPFTPSAYKVTGGWLEDKVVSFVNAHVLKNPFKGLKLVALGDSITHGQSMDSGKAPDYPFPELVASALGMTCVNYGIGGSTIGCCSNYGGTFASMNDFNAATKDTSKYYVVMTGNQSYTTYSYSGGSWSTTAVAMRTPLVDRYDLMVSDADIILVAGGTNDFQYDWEDIGETSSNSKYTFKGALNLLCEGLLTKYPQRCIVFLTPIKRCQTQQTPDGRADVDAHKGGSYGSIDSQNTFGKTLKDYGDIIKEICARYSIPVIDMYAESMLNPQVTAQSGLFDSYKTHPTQDGHNLMARIIVGKLKSIFGVNFEE